MSEVNRRAVLRRFGNALRSQRLKAGLSQVELAHRSGLDRTYVGGVERGERNISLLNIAKIAEALKISLADLLADIGSVRRRR